jgi:hypothetical protein
MIEAQMDQLAGSCKTLEGSINGFTTSRRYLWCRGARWPDVRDAHESWSINKETP